MPLRIGARTGLDEARVHGGASALKTLTISCASEPNAAEIARRDGVDRQAWHRFRRAAAVPLAGWIGLGFERQWADQAGSA